MRHQYVTAIKCLYCSLGITELISGSILRTMSKKKIENLGLYVNKPKRITEIMTLLNLVFFTDFKEYTKGCLFRVSPFLKKVVQNLKLFEGIKQ